MSIVDPIASAIETISDGFALLDAEHRFLLVNSKFRELFGVPEAVLRVGAPYADFVRALAVADAVPETDVEAFVAERMARLASPDEPFERRLPNGRWLRIADYRTEDGGVVCVRTDVTGRVLREQALAESEERFRRLSEITFEAVLILQDGKIVDHNHALAELTGYRPDELIGMSTLELLAPEFRDFARERIVNRDERSYEAVGLRKDGTRIPVELHFRHVERRGETLRVVAVRDVSDRHRVELALAEHEARTRAIVDAALDAIVTVDDASAIVEFNPAAERVFGHARADVLGRLVGDTLVPPHHRAAHHAGFARYLETGERQILGRRIEIEAMRADGAVFPVELTMTELKLGGRRLFTAFIRDLTEAKRLEQEMVQQRERIYQSEKLGALGSLLAGVAHELNNPLSVVLAQAMLLEELAKDEAARSRAERIRAAAERCAKIVHSFLAMARQRPPQRVAAHIDALVVDTLELVNYGLRAAGIEIERDIPSDLPAIRGDPDQLVQVLTNLMINAQQALQQISGRRRLRIAARYEPDAAAIRLDVDDNGPGVPEEIRGRIFDPFYTTKPVGLGTGVGLSVCHGIVASHGGTITVGDTPGGGARFTVRLPLGSLQPEETPAPAVATLGQRRRLLVVDDEPEIVATVVEILEAEGHLVDTASSGTAALRRVAEADYDLILSDLRMPDLDGPALFERLRLEQPALAGRMIVVTGDTLTADARIFLEKTGLPCLEKPFSPLEVRRIVSEALSVR